jgi:hypothetical protein
MNQTKGILLFNIKRSDEQLVRASPPHTGKHPFSLNLAAG